jgi:hypothetical protein
MKLELNQQEVNHDVFMHNKIYTDEKYREYLYDAMSLAQMRTKSNLLNSSGTSDQSSMLKRIHKYALGESQPRGGAAAGTSSRGGGTGQGWHGRQPGW